MDLSDNQALNRFFELKETLAKLQAELRTIQPKVKRFMALQQERAGLPRVTVARPNYTKVIEYRKTTAKASLNLEFITECLSAFLEGGTVSEASCLKSTSFIEDFSTFLETRRVQCKRDRNVLSYKKPTQNSPTVKFVSTLTTK